MKKIQKLTAIFGLAFLFLIFSPLNASAAGGYNTQNYDVVIDVKENQVYQINEKIKVDFLQSRHGIYRYIPFRGTTYSEINGKKVSNKYKAKISNINVNDKIDISSENSNKVIQIGDEDKTLIGEHTYNISYDYKLYNDQDNGYDEFYLNVIPNGWESSIDSASIVINMPKEFDEKDLKVFSGKYGNGSSKKINVNVSGNKVSISTSEKLEKGEGITVRIKLPETYFTGVANDKLTILLTIILALIGIVVFIGIWFKFGRDRRFVQTVEFYPPENMSPAQIGYVMDGVVDKKDLISLITYFAQKGYLTIEEKKKILGSDIILHKTEKGISESAPSYEKSLYMGLFISGDNINLNNLDTDFYEKYQSAKVQLEDSFVDSSTGCDTIFEQTSKMARIISMGLAILFIGVGSCLSCVISGDISDLFMFVFMAIALVLVTTFMIFREDKKYVRTKSRNILSVIKIAVAFLIVVGITFHSFELVAGNIIINIVYSVLAVVVCMAIGFMGRRTEYGARLLGQITGFRDFLIKAEKNKLELLVKEDPSYFYNILPYAYVLGVSDTWSKKFETINVNPPVWYTGYEHNMFNTYIFMRSMDNCTNAMSKGINISAPSTSGSGSFSGGGFSGGGVGGGGGGSW